MDARDRPLRGEIARGGVIELLRECEARRLTGALRFWGEGADAGIEGCVRLFGGEIAVDQSPRDDGQDPVDVLLDLESGRYELEPALPPLPVSRGTDRVRTGSLAVHVPVDLMAYCEQAGLTGVLELTHEGRRAEAFYEGGELLAIELDGRDATDLHEVFAWEQGRFRVTLDLDAPRRATVEAPPASGPTKQDDWTPAPPEKRESTRQFLRVVEMALVDVIDRSEKARSPTRTSPPLPPPPKKRPRPQSVPPPPARTRPDQTVRLVYLSAEPSPVKRVETESTRHVRTDVSAEVVGTAARERLEEDEPMGKNRKKNQQRAAVPQAAKVAATPAATKPAEPASGPAPTPATPGAPPPAALEALKQTGIASAWALGVLVLGLVILFVLGKLPPVQ